MIAIIQRTYLARAKR